MKIIEFNGKQPSGAEVTTFQGIEHGANVSFFIVRFSPGQGPKKHRHPYEEIFIILEGEIEATIDGETQMIGEGRIAIIPVNTWHEFKLCYDKPARLVNIHPVPQMITEWA